jgi:hypothetical protein
MKTDRETRRQKRDRDRGQKKRRGDKETGRRLEKAMRNSQFEIPNPA